MPDSTKKPSTPGINVSPIKGCNGDGGLESTYDSAPVDTNELSVSGPPESQLESAGPPEPFGELEFDSRLMMTENVIGAENRELVTVTQQFPYKAICCLIITAGNSTRLLGTGWFIHNSVLATAAHNVYDSRYGGWAQSIEVFPGRNGSSTPFGSQVVPRSRLRTNSNWISTGSPDFDYGAILLSQPFSQNLGNFALDLSTTIAGARVNIAGYPRDIPFQGHPMFTMWWHAQQVSRVSERAIFYSHDTSVGQSGSPVWIKSGEERVAVGVHTSGPTAGSPFNSATRINATVLNRFNGWVAEAG